jgi:hypothetical protein
MPYREQNLPVGRTQVVLTEDEVRQIAPLLLAAASAAGQLAVALRDSSTSSIKWTETEAMTLLGDLQYLRSHLLALVPPD